MNEYINGRHIVAAARPLEWRNAKTTYSNLPAAGFIAAGGQVTRTFCNAVGENDRRCNDMKDLLTVLTAGVLIAGALATIANMWDL